MTSYPHSPYRFYMSSEYYRLWVAFDDPRIMEYDSVTIVIHENDPVILFEALSKANENTIVVIETLESSSLYADGDKVIASFHSVNPGHSTAKIENIMVTIPIKDYFNADKTGLSKNLQSTKRPVAILTIKLKPVVTVEGPEQNTDPSDGKGWFGRLLDRIF